jgi:hypothetical protein
MNEAEKRLLDFVASIIIDLARTHTRITQNEVALWVARVALGAKR